MSQQSYIHGFNMTEENRLFHQAVFLEPSVYKKVSFSEAAKILEVGSGVGAQTQILLRRFPSARLTCVDASPSQLARAALTLSENIKAGQVSLVQADAAKLPFAPESFDGAFLCWILEHVNNPLQILKETHRCLKPGSVAYCTEVMNSTLFIWPNKSIINEAWKHLNDSQLQFGGDPNIGAKLPNLFLKAGFKDIDVHHINYQFDGRDTNRRADFLSYWEGIVLSAVPGLIETNRLKQGDGELIADAFEDLRNNPDSVFSYCAFQCTAKS